MKGLHTATFTLLVIGGLNWLLALGQWDIATWSASSGWMTLVKLIYLFVGISAIAEIVTHKKNCRHCGAGAMPGGTM